MTCFGMTLRDYFAAKALNGYLASYAPDDNPFKNGPAVARDCYELADAMLAAREADTQS